MKRSVPTFLLALLIGCAVALVGCGEDETCSDGILNQDETGVDCGGTCADCATCSDGIQNQDETGIDCGGVCLACSSCTDGIQNGSETGVDCGGPDCPSCDEEHITCEIDGVPFEANLVAANVNSPSIEFQSDQSQERQLFFVIPEGTQPGTYQWSQMGFSADYAKLFEGDYVTYIGQVEILPSPMATVRGTFGFSAWEDDGFGNPVDTVHITMGSFFIELP